MSKITDIFSVAYHHFTNVVYLVFPSSNESFESEKAKNEM